MVSMNFQARTVARVPSYARYALYLEGCIVMWESGKKDVEVCDCEDEPQSRPSQYLSASNEPNLTHLSVSSKFGVDVFLNSKVGDDDDLPHT